MSDADLQGLCLSYVKHYGLRLALGISVEVRLRELECDLAEPRKVLEAFAARHLMASFLGAIATLREPEGRLIVQGGQK